MKLVVDSEVCCKCGICSSWFPGMPEDAYGGMTVPEWAEHCMRAGYKLLFKHCPNEAVHLEDELRIVELIRIEESAQGTIGILRIDKEIFCFTLEPPDRLNERSKSSIPAKQYLCKPFQSGKFGRTFEVTDVPGRSAILFHAGNTVEHTEGCILVGESVGKLKGDRAVLNSGATFKRFAEAVGVGQEFSLTITEHY